jgi:hypothetical protein
MKATPELKTTVRSLCRGLLRAASYLPDKASRFYARNQIVDRFRNSAGITTARLKTARKYTATLERAGHGEYKCLQKVLGSTYGRIGKRRRLIISKMKQTYDEPVVEENASSEEPTLATARNSSTIEEWQNTREEEKHIGKKGRATVAVQLPPKDQNSPAAEEKEFNYKIATGAAKIENLLIHNVVLKALIQDQVKHPSHAERGKIREAQPKLPPTNTWGKPVPIKSQRGMRQRWLASTLNSLIAPLPEAEWNELRDLATGVIPFEGPPKRRAAPESIENDEKSLLSMSYIKEPIRIAHQHVLRERDVERLRHSITPRFMQRLWWDIWQQTPKITLKKGSLDDWAIAWGGSRNALVRGDFPKANAGDMKLFDGLDVTPVTKKHPAKSELQSRRRPGKAEAVAS